MTGLAIEALDWDSRFFGLKIGRLTHPPKSREELAGTLDHARRDRFDCLYSLVPADALEPGWMLQEAGFVARDVRLDFARPVDSVIDGADTRAWSEADLHALEEIAEAAFDGTRFAADPGFPRDSVRRLYRTWVTNSCRGFAQAVLVAGPAGSPQGFVTIHLESEPGQARIGLIGIASAHRSKGVGTRLIAAALGWARAQRCGEMKVATQAANVGAQRLYQRAGFTTVSAATWYHGWPQQNLASKASP
jgi:TDP-D-fucosamine acetyltransferase